MNVPAGWRYTTLGEAFKWASGGTPRRDNTAYFGGEIPWAVIGDLTDGPVSHTAERITEEGFSNSSARWVEPGSVLIALYGSIGKLGLARVRMTTNQAIAFTKPDGFVPEYLFWYLRSIRNELLHRGKGGTQRNISQEVLKQIPFPVAPFDEQRLIVAEIEKHFTRLDAAIASLKRAQMRLTAYRAAVLLAAATGKLVCSDAQPPEAISQISSRGNGQISRLRRRAGRLWGAGVVPALTEDERARLPADWRWVKVRDLGYSPEDAVQVGPMSMRSSDFSDSGVPVLNVGSVQWGHFNEAKVDYLPPEIAASFSRYQIEPGDVLFTRSGTVGRCAVALPHHAGWLMTFHLLRVRVRPDSCLPEYLRIVFEGAPHIRRQRREAAIGTTRAGFNTNLLASLDVPLPPLSVQQAIATEVDRRLSFSSALAAELARGIARCEQLRQALLRTAFSGDLTSAAA